MDLEHNEKKATINSTENVLHDEAYTRYEEFTNEEGELVRKYYRDDRCVICETFYPEGMLHTIEFFLHPDVPEVLFRANGPAYRLYYPNGMVETEHYFMHPQAPGEFYRPDGPAEIEYWENGQIKFEIYYMNTEHPGQPYRPDGPCYIEYSEDGILEEITYCLDPHNNRPYRPDGPAHIAYENGQVDTEEYYMHPEKNALYRPDGPARVSYHTNGQIKREDYCTHFDEPGRLFRADGPAWIEYDENGRVIHEAYYQDHKRPGQIMRMSEGPPIVWTPTKKHPLDHWLQTRSGYDRYIVGQYPERQEGNLVIITMIFYLLDTQNNVRREIYVEIEKRHEEHGVSRKRFVRRSDGGPTEILYDQSGQIIEKKYDEEEILI